MEENEDEETPRAKKEKKAKPVPEIAVVSESENEGNAMDDDDFFAVEEDVPVKPQSLGKRSAGERDEVASASKRVKEDAKLDGKGKAKHRK